ncbi:MAG TPA: aminoacyl-tRNA hydrolase [Opitutales bacterium]|nr:aminoacyl-tRNA hydrolase [Opitutales bacterium]
MSIAVIAGLGNPGPKYRNTRHNIGFDIVDRLAAQLKGSWRAEARFEAETATVEFEERKLLLVKPQTYMNDSGRSLGAVLRYHKLEADSLLVIYDDLTLDLGRPKLSASGSAGGHNGIADLLDRIGPGFVRYRVGIGAKPIKEMDLADYVLSQFKPAEREILSDRMPDYLDHIRLIIDKGIETAFNIINQRTSTTHERSHDK